MTELSALEDVVRVIFPSNMMREGELLPAAFKLSYVILALIIAALLSIYAWFIFGGE